MSLVTQKDIGLLPKNQLGKNAALNRMLKEPNFLEDTPIDTFDGAC